MKVEVIGSENYYKNIEHQVVYKSVDSAFGNFIENNYVIASKEDGGELTVVIINDDVFWRNFAEVLEEDVETDTIKLLTWRAKDAILYASCEDRFVLPCSVKKDHFVFVGHWSSLTKTLIAFRLE